MLSWKFKTNICVELFKSLRDLQVKDLQEVDLLEAEEEAAFHLVLQGALLEIEALAKIEDLLTEAFQEIDLLVEIAILGEMILIEQSQIAFHPLALLEALRETARDLAVLFQKKIFQGAEVLDKSAA